MPVVSFDTKADYDAAYRLRAEDGHPGTRQRVKLNYHRAVMYPLCEARATALVNHFAWPTTTRILVVGAGFGWLAEALETNHGYSNVITADVSSWIQSAQDTDEEADVDAAISAVGLDPASGEGLALKNQLHTPGNRRRHSRPIEDESLRNQGSRNRIRSLLGDINVGISEDVLPTLSDAEILDVSSDIDAINQAVQIERIHLVHVLDPTGNQDAGYNWHTLAEYKALLPNDTFMAIGSWEVL